MTREIWLLGLITQLSWQIKCVVGEVGRLQMTEHTFHLESSPWQSQHLLVFIQIFIF